MPIREICGVSSFLRLLRLACGHPLQLRSSASAFISVPSFCPISPAVLLASVVRMNSGQTRQSTLRGPRAAPSSSAMSHVRDPIAEAASAGIDLSLLDSNLALSFEERLLRHDSALEFATALREAGAVYYASTPRTSASSR